MAGGFCRRSVLCASGGWTEGFLHGSPVVREGISGGCTPAARLQCGVLLVRAPHHRRPTLHRTPPPSTTLYHPTPQPTTFGYSPLHSVHVLAGFCCSLLPLLIKSSLWCSIQPAQHCSSLCNG
ncbi:unnamed protein product [Closterium sp. NIES-53]